MEEINETNVRFRGKALLDLTHEETREALIQALNEVARLERRGAPTTIHVEANRKPIEERQGFVSSPRSA